MTTEYDKLMQSIALAYRYIRLDNTFRSAMLQISGADRYEAGPNRCGDLEVRLTYDKNIPRAIVVTTIVLVREITDVEAADVPGVLRTMFEKRLRQSMPVVQS